MFIITGGGSGIGRALAQALAVAQKEVLIVGRRESLLQETAAFSSAIHYLVADLATEQGCMLVADYLKPRGALQALVHNAGVVEPIEPLSTVNPSAWKKVMDTNFLAPMRLSQLLLPQLTGGKVLHIGSGMAYFPAVGCSAYCVSKAALAMLTRCWQLEVQDPAFASVMPGIIDTDMQGILRIAEHMEPAKADFFKTLKRENRLVTTPTIAAFLSWLLLEVDAQTYSSKEWDIYDKSTHVHWLKSPHTVPEWSR